MRNQNRLVYEKPREEIYSKKNRMIKLKKKKKKKKGKGLPWCSSG